MAADGDSFSEAVVNHVDQTNPIEDQDTQTHIEDENFGIEAPAEEQDSAEVALASLRYSAVDQIEFYSQWSKLFRYRKNKMEGPLFR